MASILFVGVGHFLSVEYPVRGRLLTGNSRQTVGRLYELNLVWVCLMSAVSIKLSNRSIAVSAIQIAISGLLLFEATIENGTDRSAYPP